MIRHLVILAVLLLTAGVACDRLSEPRLFATAADTASTPTVADRTGDASRGVRLFASYGCVSCHEIPGVPDATAVVAPPLTHYAFRRYVAGVRKNTPDNLIAWIRDPLAIDPQTAMPNLHVTEQDAKDMAAYLYTLR